MSDPDPLMAAIVAAPDDDAPRLVWADREGGERGELVVVQCALADRRRRRGREHRDLTREERRPLAVRERELIFQHKEWSQLGDFAKVTMRGFTLTPVFRRGFVDGADIFVSKLIDSADEIFARAPLLTDLAVYEDERPKKEAWAPPATAETNAAEWATSSALLAKAFERLPPGKITRLATRPVTRSVNRGWTFVSYSDAWAKIIGEARTLRGIRELEIAGGDISRVGISHLRHLEQLTRMTLNAAWGADGWIELLRALPHLHRVSFSSLGDSLHASELGMLLNAPEVTRLTELDLHSSRIDDADLQQIAEAPSLSNLTRLAVEFSGSSLWPKSGFEALARAPHLTKLNELAVSKVNDESLAILAKAPFASRLRFLGLNLSRFTSVSLSLLMNAFPSLEEVQVLASGFSNEQIAELRSVIPVVRC